MIAHLGVVGALLAGLSLFAGIRRLPAGRVPKSGSVAVIIPARNEAARLPGLLADLAAADPAPDVVIVVDDHSEDGTSDIGRERGCVVVPAPPVPHGWGGKSWACAQGVDRAVQRFGPAVTLVFLDADVRLEPTAIGAVVAEQAAAGGVVSVQPYHDVPNWYEQVSAFFNLVSVMGIGAGSRRPTGMFGPVVCVGAAEYQAVGGHRAVRGAIAEDVALAQHFTERGSSVRVYVGAPFRFRMYGEGWRSLVEGWTKNVATGAASVPAWRSVAIGLWITGLLVAARNAAALAWAPQDRAGLVAVTYLIAAGSLFVMLRRLGSFRGLVALLYPLALLGFCLLFARSIWRTFGRRSVTWKGRLVAVGPAARSRLSDDEGMA